MKRRKKECIYSLASLLVIIIFSMVAYKQVRHSENKLNRFVKSNRYRYHVFKTKGDQLLKKGRKEEALELYEKANAVKKRAKTEQAICQLLDEIIAEHIKARNWSAAALFVQKGMHYPNLKEKMENLVPYVTGKGYVSIHSTLAGVIKEYLTTNKASLSLTAPQAYTIKEYGPLPLPKMVFYEGTHHFIIQTDDGHQIYLPIELKRGETLDINIPIKSIPEGYVYVHKGDFIYGGENSVSPWNSAGPYKRSLPGFFMKKQPITLAEYEAFRHSPKYVSCLNSVLKKHNLDWKQLDMEINSIEELKPSTLNKSIKSDYVSGLSYYEALAYAKWSNSRLPTEFEWEKAARGIDGRLFLTGNTIKKDFSKTISPYGCVGLGHTVRLWTSTDYGGSRNRKVVKGSLPACSPQNLLLSSRKAFTPVVKYSSIGLITCKDISDATQQSVASFENKSKEQLLQQK